MDALKGSLYSKTMWFNGIATLLGAIDWIQGHNILIGALVPGSGPILVVVGAIGAILRVFTNKPLDEK